MTENSVSLTKIYFKNHLNLQMVNLNEVNIWLALFLEFKFLLYYLKICNTFITY